MYQQTEAFVFPQKLVVKHNLTKDNKVFALPYSDSVPFFSAEAFYVSPVQKQKPGY